MLLAFSSKKVDYHQQEKVNVKKKLLMANQNQKVESL
jgi:hypothetical protein